MAKKKFSAGLDDLFGETREAIQDAQPPQPVFAIEEKPGETVSPRRTTSKNFASDLDALFRDAFTVSYDEPGAGQKKGASSKDDLFGAERSAYKNPLSGLDALIRQTVDTSLAGFDHAPIKRITFVFENQKIEKLKSIAKREHSFLKDLVNGVISEFIDNYEQKTGKLI